MALDLAEALLRTGLVDGLQLKAAEGYQRRWGKSLQRSVVDLGFVPESTLLSTVAALAGTEFVVIGDREVPPEVVRRIPARLARARRAVPLELARGRRGPLVVAVEEPENLALLDELAFAAGVSVQPLLAGAADLDRALARLYPAPRAA